MLQLAMNDDGPDPEPLLFFAVVPDSFMGERQDGGDERATGRFRDNSSPSPLVSRDPWSF